MRAVRPREHSFTNEVDSWVSEATSSGVHRFDDLLRWLPGVYPLEAAASVRRLRADGDLSNTDASRLLAGTTSRNRIVEGRLSFPAPHPLDSDWRFTSPTSAMLLHESMAVRKPGDTVICLGTPSVFQEAHWQGMGRSTRLIDGNTAVICHFAQLGLAPQVWQADLLSDPLPPVRSSVVVADPPWYPDEMTAFLWSASRICTFGGHVLISIPARGTRPGIAAEVGRLLDYSRTVGFEVTRVEPGVLEYESPPFERNALKAAGIALSSGNWRRADLCVLRLAVELNAPRPLPTRISESWYEEALFGTRMRLRKKFVRRFADPTIIKLVNGDVLPTVSRRHSLRTSVDVWTTGNRVFACAGTAILRIIVRSLACRQDPVVRVAFALRRALSNRERELIGVAAEQSVALAAQEQRDFGIAGIGSSPGGTYL